MTLRVLGLFLRRKGCGIQGTGIHGIQVLIVTTSHFPQGGRFALFEPSGRRPRAVPLGLRRTLSSWLFFSPLRSPDHTSARIADELLDPRSCEHFVHAASWLVRGHGCTYRRLPLDTRDSLHWIHFTSLHWIHFTSLHFTSLDHCSLRAAPARGRESCKDKAFCPGPGVLPGFVC